MILGWYLLGQLVAWCCLPLTWSAFHRLEDRGYSVRHAIGLLLTGFLLWVGTAMGLLTNDRQGAFVALGGTLLIGALAVRRGLGPDRTLLRDWLSKRWRLILIYEGLFLVVFVGWCWVRMQDPAINHTEQPMDFMLLAGMLNYDSVPPQDPWLSGYAISYYYFGYWLQATLAQVVGSRPEVAYNLAQAWWLAMVWSGAFGVVFNLLAVSRERRSPSLKFGPDDGPSKKLDWAAVLGGLLGAFFVAGAANLDGTLRALRHLGGSPEDSVPWWWFRSSRVLVDTGSGVSAIELITEFPAFSFVLGDNHPHLLSLPFVLLAVALALNLQQTDLGGEEGTGLQGGCPGATSRIGWSTIRRVGQCLWTLLARSTSSWPWTAWLVVALIAGAPLAINTWDLPAVWLMLAFPAWTVGVGALTENDARASGFLLRRAALGMAGVAMFWAALTISTLALYFPYLLTAQSQARGWLPNLLHPTSLWQFLLVFGAFLPAAGALLLAPRDVSKSTRKKVLVVTGAVLAGGGATLMVGAIWATGTERGREWLEPYVQEQSLVELAVGRWLERPFVLLGLALFVGIVSARFGRFGASAEGHSRGSFRDPDRFALLLLTIALGAALLPELAFVHDVFSTRINTVFKFYYQAWVMVALASAYTIIRYRTGAGLRTLLTRVSLVLLLVSAVYPFAALKSKRAAWAGEVTLDGLSYLTTDERAAIKWIRRWTRAGDVVLQAVGSSYRADHARASSATGRATLLGWKGHEVQWRGASFGFLAAGREAAAESIFRTGGAKDIEEATGRFSIDYIYVGPVERQLYGLDEDREQLLASLTETVFSSGDIRILRVVQMSRSDG